MFNVHKVNVLVTVSPPLDAGAFSEQNLGCERSRDYVSVLTHQ